MNNIIFSVYLLCVEDSQECSKSTECSQSSKYVSSHAVFTGDLYLFTKFLTIVISKGM